MRHRPVSRSVRAHDDTSVSLACASNGVIATIAPLLQFLLQEIAAAERSCFTPPGWMRRRLGSMRIDRAVSTKVYGGGFHAGRASPDPTVYLDVEE